MVSVEPFRLTAALKTFMFRFLEILSEKTQYFPFLAYEHLINYDRCVASAVLAVG